MCVTHALTHLPRVALPVRAGFGEGCPPSCPLLCARAMADVHPPEKPSSTEWFPHNVPGVFKLSTLEVANDIDFITSSINPASSEQRTRYKRKVKLDTPDPDKLPIGAIDVPNRGSTSKRARLYGKLTEERKKKDNVKTSQQTLRSELETARSESVTHRDTIARTKREIVIAREEEQKLENEHKALQDQMQEIGNANEATKVIYDRELMSMRNSHVSPIFLNRLPELRDLDAALKEKDIMIEEQEGKVKSVTRVREMLLEASQMKQPVNSGEASATTVEGGAHAEFIQKYSAAIVQQEDTLRKELLLGEEVMGKLNLKKQLMEMMNRQMEEQKANIVKLEKAAKLEATKMRRTVAKIPDLQRDMVKCDNDKVK
jgi:hypothetical protein